MALNIFGQPPEYLSGLLGIDPEKLRKQAFGTGLVNTALAFAAQPRNQGYGSVLPYAARALMAGQQGAQGVYQGALQDYQTRQQIEQLKMQNEQQRKLQEMLGGIQNPEERLLAELDPKTYIKRKLGPESESKFGLSPRIGINPKTNKPEFIQFSDVGNPKWTGITPTQDEIEIAKLVDQGVLPEGYIGRPPQRQQPANGLPTNNFNLPYDVSFGAPGTTATDVAEGVTGESSIQLRNPAQPQRALPPASQRKVAEAAAIKKAEKDIEQATASEAESKKNIKRADTLLAVAMQANDLLNEGPTESGIGAVVDYLGRQVGVSSKSAEKAAELETLSGWMVANVPRMEGPQSNFDVENYKTMAAKVGDRTIPISERKAALRTLINLQNKYKELNQEEPQRNEAAPVKINGDADYNKLPSGTIFIDPLGNKRRKP